MNSINFFLVEVVYFIWILNAVHAITTQRYSMEGDFCVYSVGIKLKKHHKINVIIFTDTKFIFERDDSRGTLKIYTPGVVCEE
jgi:hypothetical protein